MSTTSTLVTILVVVLVLAAAAAIIRWKAPGVAGRILPGRSHPRDRRRRYGREYDRLYAAYGDQAAVEQEFERRERERAALSVAPLDGADRDRLEAEWASVQAGFVDDPGCAARRAEQLIGEALTLRGYPSGDSEHQLALASVDHAHTLSEFRDGHELWQRSNTGARGVDPTEQLRQAMLRFRVFFEDLVGAERGRRGPVQREKVSA
jgi:hypothetical protein